MSNIIFSSSKFQVVKCTTRYELFSSELSSINYIISGEKRRRTAAEEDKLVWSACSRPSRSATNKKLAVLKKHISFGRKFNFAETFRFPEHDLV